MSYESLVGRDCKVTIGANNVLGMGTWTISGGSYGVLDDSEFGDQTEQILRGIRTGGTVRFSGKYKKDDTQGQDLLMLAYWSKSDLTDIRCYVDNTSYYTPNSTTAAGGGLPAGIEVSHIKILTEPTITSTVGELMSIEFEGRIIGAMRRI